MNTLCVLASRKYLVHRVLTNFRGKLFKYLSSDDSKFQYTTTIDTVITESNNTIENQTENLKYVHKAYHDSLKPFDKETKLSDNDIDVITKMTLEEVELYILEISRKKENKKMTGLLLQCEKSKILFSNGTVFKLFQTSSLNGDINIVAILRNYCLKLSPKVYVNNGEFQHFLARAHCMRGNSEQGLNLLKESYHKYENLRGLYRYILKDLIIDSVQNRSEASMVIFKRNVLEYSEKWEEHYPLLCFWHSCWISSWFSDQMLANELFHNSDSLRNIVAERVAALSINILRNEFNEDAVLRLLQLLIKYDKLVEYAKVLEILFGHKLKRCDLRGCREIINNCEALGISLPSDQQGKYVKMLITKDDNMTFLMKNFKLKF